MNKEYIVILYKTVEYRAEIKVEAEDSNAAMEEGKRMYEDDGTILENPILAAAWIANNEKLTEVGVLLPHAPVSER
jgi:hypothetical protein